MAQAVAVAEGFPQTQCRTPALVRALAQGVLVELVLAVGPRAVVGVERLALVVEEEAGLVSLAEVWVQMEPLVRPD